MDEDQTSSRKVHAHFRACDWEKFLTVVRLLGRNKAWAMTWCIAFAHYILNAVVAGAKIYIEWPGQEKTLVDMGEYINEGLSTTVHHPEQTKFSTN